MLENGMHTFSKSLWLQDLVSVNQQ